MSGDLDKIFSLTKRITDEEKDDETIDSIWLVSFEFETENDLLLNQTIQVLSTRDGETAIRKAKEFINKHAEEMESIITEGTFKLRGLRLLAESEI